MNQTIMPRHKIGARAKFRLEESERIKDSATLAVKFPRLKSLRVDLEYYTADGTTRSSQIKYLVNLAHAKSVFRFDCLNKECVRGDFDLSEVLTEAVAARRTSAIGEMRCQGWRNKDEIRKVYCRNLLRYKLRLGY
jgi:hypothetical protein